MMKSRLQTSLTPRAVRPAALSMRTIGGASYHRLEMHITATSAEEPVPAKPRRTRKKKADTAAATVPPPRTVAERPATGEASSSSPASASLHRLHGTSDNLRALLERRAQRQQRELPLANTAAAAPTTPAQISRPYAPLVPAEAPPQRRSAKVRFNLPFHVEYGQQLYVVGGCSELGNWILADAVPMSWSDGDVWNASVDLPAGAVLEYKYVVVGSGGHAAAWQVGNNQVLALRSADDAVEVHDNWNGSPGAQIVATGMAPVTRENRLVSWATEIEAQLTSQRQELRRARMELVAAQEDAKLAREESRRLKAALATSEAERIAAISNFRQAESVNHLLQAKLSETTVSFTQALEVAMGLLDKASSPVPSSRKGTTASGSSGNSAGTTPSETAAAAPEGKGDDKDSSITSSAAPDSINDTDAKAYNGTSKGTNLKPPGTSLPWASSVSRP